MLIKDNFFSNKLINEYILMENILKYALIALLQVEILIKSQKVRVKIAKVIMMPITMIPIKPMNIIQTKFSKVH